MRGRTKCIKSTSYLNGSNVVGHTRSHSGMLPTLSDVLLEVTSATASEVSEFNASGERRERKRENEKEKWCNMCVRERLPAVRLN